MFPSLSKLVFFFQQIVRMNDKVAMFDKEILQKLNFEDLEGLRFNPAVTQNDPGENLHMRPLHRDDYNHGEHKFNSNLQF